MDITWCIFFLWLLSLPVLYLIDLTVWFLSDERRQQAIEDLITKNINEQEDIDSGNLRVGADWMGGKLKSDRIEENQVEVFVEKEIIITEEVVNPISYIILGFSIVLIIISGLIFRKAKN